MNVLKDDDGDNELVEMKKWKRNCVYSGLKLPSIRKYAFTIDSSLMMVDVDYYYYFMIWRRFNYTCFMCSQIADIDHFICVQCAPCTNRNSICETTSTLF